MTSQSERLPNLVILNTATSSNVIPASLYMDGSDLLLYSPSALDAMTDFSVYVSYDYDNNVGTDNSGAHWNALLNDSGTAIKLNTVSSAFSIRRALPSMAIKLVASAMVADDRTFEVVKQYPIY